jgi:hypothetical protein
MDRRGPVDEEEPLFELAAHVTRDLEFGAIMEAIASRNRKTAQHSAQMKQLRLEAAVFIVPQSQMSTSRGRD